MATYVTYTKHRLSTALLSLLEDKPLADISISELAERAHMSRASFYRNFGSKEDVLVHRLSSSFKKWGDERGTFHLEGDSFAQAKEFLEFMYAERDLMQTIYKADALDVLLTFLDDMIGPVEGDRPEDAFYRSYHLHGVFGVCREWIKQGMTEQPEKVAELIVYGMREARGSLLRKKR